MQPTCVLDQLRECIRYVYHNLSTDLAYVYWPRFF